MYESFYNLSTNAFRLTPDPKFCFAHASHKQARAYLEYALKLGEGFIMVTGRPGTGKTTLIEAFINEPQMSEVVAERIAASNLEATELLRTVAYAYGIDAEGIDKATLRRRIQAFFTQQVLSGKRVLLVIDEAQGLSHPAIEELRLLSDLQVGVRPLLQLFLVGHDALRDLMRSRDMEQFQQRVIGTCHLEPLDLHDTRGYVEYRLRQAGWKGDPEITGAAIVAIHQHSQGVPRHINKTCTRLLLHGLMEGKHKLDNMDVVTIAAELCEEQLGPLTRNQAVSRGTAEVGREPAIQHAPQPPRQTKRSIKKAAAARWDEIVALGAMLRHYGMKTARKFDGSLQWPGGLAVKFGAVAVATLSIAALATNPEDDTGDHDVALAVYSESAEPASAQPAAKENIGAVNPRVIQQQPARHDTEPGQPAGEADTAPLAGATIRQPAPGSPPTDTSMPDSVPPIHESRQVAVVSSMTTAADATDDAAHEQVAMLAGDTNDATLQEATPQAEAQLASVDNDVTPAPVSLEQKIDELLSLGRQALIEDRLLIPSNHNAHHYYRQVLILEPDNAEAGQGIEQIVRRYTLFARRALEREDEKKTRRYIERGLLIRPGDRQLLALQERMNTWLAKLELEATPAAPPPPRTVETPPPKPENFVSRLKAFFNAGRDQGDNSEEE